MSHLKGGETRRRRRELVDKGFLARMRKQKRPRSGSHIIAKRRAKGRRRLTISDRAR